MTFSPPNAPSAPVPGSGDWTLRRPLAVALVVVLCYVEMALGGWAR